MRNILAALDFSELTAEVLRRSAGLARPFGAKVWLVHVAAPDPSFVGYKVGPQYIRNERAKELRGEHRQLQDYAKQLIAGGLQAEALLIQGPLVSSLLEEASDVQADLIVVGVHSSSLFDKLLGNTWQDLIRKSTIPLLLAPEGR